MSRRLGSLVLTACLVAFGVAGGWFAARQGSDAHGGDEPGGATARAFSPQALANMGVTVGEVRLVPFVREAKVLATIVDAPLNERPVSALLGGIVRDVHVRPGAVVRPGDPIVTIVRAPIARPVIELTSNLLRPVSENVHDLVSRLRSADGSREIFEAEVARVRRFAEDGGEDALPILPRKTLIDLEYDLARARQEASNVARELERHGLSPEEIEGLRRGEPPPDGRGLWRRALEQNGLWGDLEERLSASLPAGARDRAWTIAAIGELAAAGLVTPRLLTALEGTPHLAEHFVEMAALLLGGDTVERVELLARAGMLEPIATVRAPAEAPLDLDVAVVDVRAGQHVAPGDRIALLHDPRHMGLRLEPLGHETPHVVRALERKTSFDATPLLAGAGPLLEGLLVDRFETRTALEERGSVAWAICENEEIAHGDARSWRLRVGLRYVARIPMGDREERFVLPVAAVGEDGSERVVYLEDGRSFRAQPVRVEFEDDEVVVVANDGSIFAGDRVALSGAFALGLALQSDSGGAVDPHAGHGH